MLPQEWLWPVGYLLQAMLNFSPLVGGVSELKRTIRQVKFVISRHFVELQKSPWRSLPELTNANGKPCVDSSPAQAWSMASILEVSDITFHFIHFLIKSPKMIHFFHFFHFIHLFTRSPELIHFFHFFHFFHLFIRSPELIHS